MTAIVVIIKDKTKIHYHCITLEVATTAPFTYKDVEVDDVVIA